MALCSAPAVAGVVHGVVVEGVSSRPLARTRVFLQTLGAGGPRGVAAVLTNRAGQFVFNAVPDGQYQVSAMRAGFAPAVWGQKRPYAAGTWLAVTAESVTFAEIRMARLGAVSGRVLDENRVGLPEVPVLAYPARIPLRAAVQVKSDDRGFYRLAGLAPGRYWIRTGALELEDRTGLLPTFAPEYTGTRDARVVRVEVDQEIPEVDLIPVAGRLVRLGGQITGCQGQVKVTLSSDTGRRETTAGCAGKYGFEALAPGDYELLAERREGEPLAAHLELHVDRDTENANLNLTPWPRVQIESEARLTGRRRDAAGPDPDVELPPGMTPMLPGYWDLTAQPEKDRALVSIGAIPGSRRASRRPDPDWFEVYLEPVRWNRVQAKWGKGAELSGKAPPGMPIYLWPVDGEARRRVNGPKTTYADLRGRYQFPGLAAGRYLVLSSPDLAEVDEEALRAARAQEVVLEEGQALVRDLNR